MIDLFGLGKNQEPQEPASDAGLPAPVETPVPEDPAPAAPRGSHKLWAFLLVLDSVFVIVFAGAVAAKVYQHWKSPAVALTPKPRAPKAVPAPAPAPAPVASSAPVVPEPAKTPEPPKAPEPAAKDAPRPPKPSMLSDAPKHRETPKLADAGARPRPPPNRPPLRRSFPPTERSRR
ncbi:MAG: hypothetical protein M0D55_13425 [Elusimicrobiota bacterium]|nr:MAG: hypothetical protein M0D55_13425 [Elusimicrobiota bacterium]